MKQYTHIFFDLDHTLWDFKSNSRETIKEALDHFGIDIPVKQFVRTYEQINEYYWGLYRKGKIEKAVLRTIRFSKTFEEFNIADVDMVNDFCDYYLDHGPRKKRLFPGAIETLEYLEEKYVLHLITNGFKEVQKVKMEASGLDRFFSMATVSEDVGVKKPHPQIFEHALEKARGKASESIMVGDNMEADIKGAHKAGMDSVHFNPEGNRHNFKPTYVIEALPELKEIV